MSPTADLYSNKPDRDREEAIGKGYVGVRFHQGRPLLDRDLNLLNDLISTRAQEIVGRYMGNAVPAGNDGFAIRALTEYEGEPGEQEPKLHAEDFVIRAGSRGEPGRLLVDGIEAVIEKETTFLSQPVTPTQTLHPEVEGEERWDVVYLDVWLGEVHPNEDQDLYHDDIGGVDTSSRLKPCWQVCVAEGTTEVPPPDSGHHRQGLALLRRRKSGTLRQNDFVDIRPTAGHGDAYERRLATLASDTGPSARASVKLDGSKGTIAAIAVDLGGAVHVATVIDDQPALVAIDPELRFPRPPVFVAESGGKAIDLALDRSGGALVLVEVASGEFQVVRIAPDGTIRAFPLSNVEKPQSLAVDPEGFIYVYDCGKEVTMAKYGPDLEPVSKKTLQQAVSDVDGSLAVSPRGTIWATCKENSESRLRPFRQEDSGDAGERVSLQAKNPPKIAFDHRADWLVAVDAAQAGSEFELLGATGQHPQSLASWKPKVEGRAVCAAFAPDGILYVGCADEAEDPEADQVVRLG